jgi:hypothetical protein
MPPPILIDIGVPQILSTSPHSLTPTQRIDGGWLALSSRKYRLQA